MNSLSHLSNPSKENENHRKVAMLFAFFYMILICFLLWFVKFSSPPKEDMNEGEGLMVDFGYTEVGLGDDEPAPQDKMVDINVPSPGNPPLTQEVKEAVLVQESEETFAIETPKESKVKEVKKVVVENMLKTDKKAKEISKNPSTNPSESKPKANQNALFTGFSGKGTGSGSQGVKEGEGNMGDPSGSKSNNYSGQSTGLGNSGTGRGLIGSGLKGRKLDNIPKISDNSNKEGVIIITVKVDNLGKVLNAEYKAQGSTITDLDLIDKCEKAAMRAKFTPSENLDVDRGTLVFNFIVR
jgi:outer membrane biosynthesis protein TonB